MQMASRQSVKLIHFAGTVWFGLCAVFLIFLSLLEAGVQWWIIFSLSGYSAILLVLLISVYLFAVFRVAVRSQKIEVEHPLTSSAHYMMFYCISPFLGSAAALISSFGIENVLQRLVTIAVGSLVTTFLVWIVFDPAIGLLEMLLPPGRQHRHRRLARARALREKQNQDNAKLLTEIMAREQSVNRQRQEVLQPLAEELAELLADYEQGNNDAEAQAVKIGAHAWHLGGIGCMHQLHDIALKLHTRRCPHRRRVDYVSLWWAGIGTWFEPPVFENLCASGQATID